MNWYALSYAAATLIVGEVTRRAAARDPTFLGDRVHDSPTASALAGTLVVFFWPVALAWAAAAKLMGKLR